MAVRVPAGDADETERRTLGRALDLAAMTDASNENAEDDVQTAKAAQHQNLRPGRQ